MCVCVSVLECVLASLCFVLCAYSCCCCCLFYCLVIINMFFPTHEDFLSKTKNHTFHSLRSISNHSPENFEKQTHGATSNIILFIYYICMCLRVCVSL